MSETSAPVASNPTPTSAPSGSGQNPNQSSENAHTPKNGQTSTTEIGKKTPNLDMAKPTSPSSEMYDVKVNGKMVRMSRQEVLDHASMSHTANSKFDEASKLRKEVDKIISTAKTNPIEALMNPALGLTKDQIRTAFEHWYNQEYIEPETLTVDQKKIKEYEMKLKKYEEEESQKKQQAEHEENEKMTTQQREYLQTQIIEAIDKSGLPKSKDVVKKIAFYMRQNLINGWDAPMDMIIKQVKADRQSMLRDDVQNSNAEQIIELLGDDVVNKIREHDLKRLRERRQAPSFQKNSSITNAGSYSSNEKVSSSEVTRRLRDMRLGKF